jgi:hypothetical protein
MGPILKRIAPRLALLTLIFLSVPAAAHAAQTIRLGYLEQPGSALCLLAAANGFFREADLEVALIPYHDSASGHADLAAGKLAAGAFAVGETLQAIAAGGKLRIIAGGGAEKATGLLDELDASARQEEADRGIVLVAGEGTQALDKDSLVKLVGGLVRADLLLQSNPSLGWSKLGSYPHWRDRPVHFDPSPDYWRLVELWKRHGLQGKGMPRSFLADHVYEEIYCDALDDLADGAGGDNPALKKLVSKAGCLPDCCPEKKPKKQLDTEGGTR